MKENYFCNSCGLKFKLERDFWDHMNDKKKHPERFVAEEKIMTEEVRITSSTGAQKGSKLARYDLIPALPLKMLAELYGKGSEKYAERNWEGGYDWSLSFAAMQRHSWQFWNGEDFDPEMMLPHLASVAWHAFALMEFMITHPEFDNRPNGGQR